MFKSKILAWCALALVVILICLTFGLRTEWWCFIDIFFAFMMVFCHLLAIYIVRMSQVASVKLDRLALIFLILAVISFIAEYIALT